MRRKYISPKSEKERYIMTFSLFEKEIHYIWEGNIYENSKKDLRRWEGSKKEIHSAMYTYNRGKKDTPATKELWSKIAFFKWAWQTLKVLPRPWTLYLLKVRHWSFPMRYCMTLYLKGLQNYRPSKFEQLDFSPFTIQIRTFSRL